ncbi:hypercellular protein [Moniliophthora roreri MCA 2997]|uniref:Hypercellular protein n=1 Tax=Moniliophthora roreri (strain MCA 2997) TaxID=1381753 RepID=V2XCS6_MONRO|nr:hypercellular protein [Moniliophthora roreri MCA 2997]
MDTHVFASLAQVRILLVPVGPISSHSFEKYASEITSFDSIRLGDIPEATNDERARFTPKPLSTGHLHLSFPSHPPPISHNPLSLIRPSHFPLAVIGIASCSHPDNLGAMLAQFNGILMDMFPGGSIYPLAKNCFVFEEGDGTCSSESIPGLVVFPGMMGNRKLYIGTLLADLCSHVLGEFSILISRLESPLGNEYLNASLLPTLPSLSEVPMSLDQIPPLPSHSSQPELSKGGVSTPQMKRNSSLGVPTVAKKRMSGIGTASSHGRLFKVMGDLFLLSGRTEDALIWYNEALQLFKPSLDGIWQASALEGLATISILDSWSAGHGLQTSTSASREPWSEVTEKLVQATALYYKPTSVEGDQNLSLLSYLYCCCILRHSSLLFAIWSAKGWGPLAFTTMLQPGPTPYLPPTVTQDARSSSSLERLSIISGISRNAIASVIAQGHGPWLLHLDARERLSILEAMASLYSCLGYRRKEAYVLREVLGCVLDLVVCGRDDNTVPPIANGTGLGIQNTAGGTQIAIGHVGIRVSERSDGNQSVLTLLKRVCRVLGVNLDAVEVVELGATKAPSLTGDPGDREQEPFGWPELQVGVVRESVAVAEALPDFLAVAQYSLSALKTLLDILAPPDQYHLNATAARALSTAKRRGSSKGVEFWPSRPVVSITLAPLPLIRLPIEKPMSALQPRPSDPNTILSGATDPFLYNPRRVNAAQGSQLVIQNETLEFVVLLQNPYVFDLELQKVSLSTSGVPFVTEPVSIVIPANSYHRVVLEGVAQTTGNLVVRGCIVQAPGGSPREFVLPLATSEEEERLTRNRSARYSELDRFKYSGLDALPWEKVLKRQSKQLTKATLEKPLRFLECKVVPEQPLLRIRRTSVTHGALMLYDGETSSLQVTFENISHLPIDFLRLVFDDSTITPAQQALAEGNLSVFDTYETEYLLIHKPVFSWNKKDVITIPPHHKTTVSISCFGKVGCTEGAIHASYSYVHRDRSGTGNAPDVFHARQLSFPLMVTVYHMLECHGIDVLPCPDYYLKRPDKDERLTMSDVDDSLGWCLFAVDVRNAYGAPFEVYVERTQEDVSNTKASVTIPPGLTSRVIVPIKKFILTEEHISQPIPTLSDRQFVVDKLKMSADEQKTQRELFWYREELFKSIHCGWREANGTRFGDLSLRQQRLTMNMLDTLRTETTILQMSLVDTASPGTAIPQRMGRYHPPPNRILHLRTRITNMARSSLVCTLDLQIEPTEHFIHDGALSDIPVGRLDKNESREVDTAICFLSQGRFEVRGIVRVVGDPHVQGKGLAHLVCLVEEDGNIG